MLPSACPRASGVPAALCRAAASGCPSQGPHGVSRDDYLVGTASGEAQHRFWGPPVAPGTEAPARALWADMACRLSVALCPPGQVCLLTRAVSTCVTGGGSRRMRPPWAGVWAASAAAHVHLPSTRPPRKSARERYRGGRRAAGLRRWPRCRQRAGLAPVPLTRPKADEATWGPSGGI